jgi:hypothetical protein
MSATSATSIKDRLIRIYGSGFAVFIVAFGSISALIVLLSHLK